MGLKGVRRYARVVSTETLFEDAGDYEPSHPLACVVGEASGGVAKVRARIRAGDHPGALRLAARLRADGLQSRELVVQHHTAWSLLNWLPIADDLKSTGPEDQVANLVLARQAIAMGWGDDAVHFTDLLLQGALDTPYLRVLRQIAGVIQRPGASPLAALRTEVEAMDDCSLHYSLALAELRQDREAGMERLQLCVERRPDVAAHTGRLMAEFLRDEKYENAFSVYSEHRAFAETFYVPCRMAIVCYGALEDYYAAMDELQEMYRETPVDRIIAANLLADLGRRHAYFKMLQLWLRWYRTFSKASPK